MYILINVNILQQLDQIIFLSVAYLMCCVTSHTSLGMVTCSRIEFFKPLQNHCWELRPSLMLFHHDVKTVTNITYKKLLVSAVLNITPSDGKKAPVA